MSIVTLDLETYYDQAEYSLKKMSTEDYVDDPRFEVIGLSHMVDDGPRTWFTDTMKETAKYLKSLKLDRHAACAHNMKFDGLVLARHFDIYPRVYLDTLSMATPSLKPRLKSLSLAALAKHFDLPDKGDEVVRASGKRRLDFTPEDLAEYGRYCDHDTWLCREIFKKVREDAYQMGTTRPWMKTLKFSNDELELIDMTMRMYIQPQFGLDASVFTKGLETVRENKAAALAEMEVMGITAAVLRSSDKFAQLLRDRGIEPPMKDSPASVKKGDKPPKQTYAFGKDDPEFLDLREEFAEDLEMTMIFNTRVGEKSTQEETRNVRLLDIAVKRELLRVPAKYYSAHTGRYGGSDGINLLNLPNVDKSNIRYGIVAPPGYSVLASDYAAIEARLVAVLAGQMDLIEIFATGRDPYSEFATELFGFPVSKELADKDPKIKRARRLGKDIILGSGFGMGWKKYKRSVRKNNSGVTVTDEEAQRHNRFYRDKFSMIPLLWKTYDAALHDLVMARKETQVGPVRFVWLDKKDAAIVLPNGMMLLYPNLRTKKIEYSDGTYETKIVCNHARDKFPRNIWGGVITENICQALSRVITCEDMLEIKRKLGLNTAIQVYDSVGFVVKTEEAEATKVEVEKIMTRSRPWLPDLPMGVESKIGPSFGHV